MGTLIKHTVLRPLGNSYGVIISKMELKRIKIAAKKGNPIWIAVSDKPFNLK